MLIISTIKKYPLAIDHMHKISRNSIPVHSL